MRTIYNFQNPENCLVFVEIMHAIFLFVFIMNNQQLMINVSTIIKKEVYL